MKGSSREKLPEPVRPHMPLLARAALVFWAACACSYYLGRTFDCALLRIICIGLTIAAMVTLLICFLNRKAGIFAVVAALIIGCLMGAARSTMLLEASVEAPHHDARYAECLLLQDPRKGSYGFSCLANASFADGYTCKVRLVFDDAGGVACGESIRIGAGHIIAAEPINEQLWQSGAAASITVDSFDEVRQGTALEHLSRIRKNAIGAIASADIGEEEKLLLQALVCGWRMDLAGSDLYAFFKSCGIAHLVAVSGAHLVIVAGLFAALLRRARMPRAPSIGILIFIMCVYFVFAGEPVSALRACIMSILSLFSYYGRRRPSALNAVGVAILGLIALEPECCISVSFTLSCLSTFGIALFAPLIAYRIGKTPLGRFGLITDSFALTLSALMATLPLSCALFSQLPIIAPVANILVAPLFPMACAFGLGAGFFAVVFPKSAGILIAMASLPSRALSLLSSALAQIPYGCIPVYLPVSSALILTAIVIVVFYIRWPTRKGRSGILSLFMAIALMIACIAFGMRPDRIVMLDIGQGDAFLLCSRGTTLLIDTGNQDSRLLGALARQGIVSIDAVLITHADDDHCGSLDALASCVEVRTVLVSEDLYTSSEEKAVKLLMESQKASNRVEAIEYGDRIEIGGFEARVVWPHRGSTLEGNAASLCVIADYDADGDGLTDVRTLFTGDAESGEISCIADEQNLGNIDILKVGHHGARNGTTSEIVQRLSPSIALISVGENNRYGHPSSEALDALESAQCDVFRTDIDGDVSCIMGSDGISVQTQR